VTGPGTLGYSVDPNPGAARQGELLIAGQTFLVLQEAGCSFNINLSSQDFGPAGGTGQFTVTGTPAGCSSAWSAVSEVAWIQVTSGASGVGSGTVGYTVQANPDNVLRSGAITVDGKRFTVNQTGACAYSLSKNQEEFQAPGGPGSVNLQTTTGCGWTVSTFDDWWITITSALSGTGPATITYEVALNPGTDDRWGRLHIAGLYHYIHQGPGCRSFQLSPTSRDHGAGAATGQVAVTGWPTGCTTAWTALSLAPSWLHITSGAAGTGDGSVTYSVDANPTPAQRVGTLTIAGQTFTVTQSGACAFSLSKTQESFRAAGGNGSVNVQTSTGCPWTAISESSWIHVTSGGGGTGPGTVTYTVDPNTGPARVGEMLIGGQHLRVSQDFGCVRFELTPASRNHGSGAERGEVAVTGVAEGCSSAWTATPDAAWIKLLSGAGGVGTGAVAYAVEANPSATPRSGTITIGGQKFTVNQAAAPPPRVVINQVDISKCPEIRLLVSVTNESGQPITGLPASAFKLKEDGQNRSFTMLLAARLATAAVAVAIDQSASLGEAGVEEEKTAVKALIEQLQPDDRVAVFRSSDDAGLVQDFTPDRAQVFRAVDSLDRSRMTSLYDAVIAQALALQPGRRATVVISRGLDDSSAAGLGEAIAQARLAGTPVFAVGLGSGDHSALTQLATETGGRYWGASSEKDLVGALTAVGQTISNQYALTYTTSSAETSHTVEVEVTHNGAKASTTTTVGACAPSGSATLDILERTAPPGGVVEVPVTIAGGGTSPTSFQFDLGFDAAKLTLNTISKGASLTSVGKDVTWTELGAGSYRIVGAGLNTTPIPDGTVVLLSFTLKIGFTKGVAPLTPSNAQAVNAQGQTLTTTASPGSVTATLCTCDVNGDGAVNVADVQLVINMTLGRTPAGECGDVNLDGAVNVADVQLVINGALGLKCP
jgi:VWFA-related protein